MRLQGFCQTVTGAVATLPFLQDGAPGVIPFVMGSSGRVLGIQVHFHFGHLEQVAFITVRQEPALTSIWYYGKITM
jgi:hypothetical protein